MRKRWNLVLFSLMVLTAFASACEGYDGATSTLAGPGNRPPEVPTINIPVAWVQVGASLRLDANSVDPDGDALEYFWTADAGTFSDPYNRSTTWTAPNDKGSYDISVEVSDGRSRTIGSHSIEVLKTRGYDVIQPQTSVPEDRSDSYIYFPQETSVSPPLKEEISVRTLTDQDAHELPPEKPDGRVIVTLEVLPDDLEFDPPAELSFRLPPGESFPSGTELDVYQYVEDLRDWQCVGFARVEAGGNRAVGRLEHTTLFALVERAAAPPTPTPTPSSTGTPMPTKPPISTPTRTVTPTPDLSCLNAEYVADVTVQDNTLLDKRESFVKTWRVRNSGTCAWPASTRLVYASGDQMSAPDGVLVGALGIGDTIDIPVDMVAPSADGSFQGTWRFVNDQGIAFGTRLTVVIRVGATPTPTTPLRPDLRLQLSASASAKAGGAVQVSVQVWNAGNAPALGTAGAGSDGYMVDIVLSSDTSVPEGWATYLPNYREDVLLKGGRISNTDDLAPGQDRLYQYSYEIQADTPIGKYYICARVDPGRNVTESDENNNVACVLIRIEGAPIGKPDLRLQLSAPETVNAGESVQVPVRVWNAGNAPAPGTASAGSDGYMVDIVLSSDTIVPEGWATYSPNYREDVLLKGGRISNTDDLAPGQDRLYQYSYEIQIDTSKGPYYICARVDPGRNVTESNENNNVACVRVRVYPPPVD